MNEAIEKLISVDHGVNTGDDTVLVYGKIINGKFHITKTKHVSPNSQNE